MLFVIAWTPRLVSAQRGGGGNTPPPPGGGGNAPPPPAPTAVKLTNPLKAESLAGFIEQVLIIVRDIGFLVAVFFIVYAGFLFVTARGDETQLTKAKGAFLWAVVGTAVLLGAWIFAKAIQGTVNAL